MDAPPTYLTTWRDQREGQLREAVRGPRPAPWFGSPQPPSAAPELELHQTPSPLLCDGDSTIVDPPLHLSSDGGLADGDLSAAVTSSPCLPLDQGIPSIMTPRTLADQPPAETTMTRLTASGIISSNSRPPLTVTVPIRSSPASSQSSSLSPLSPSCAARCLTDQVRLVGNRPYAQGGFSDVWRGTLPDDDQGRIEDVSLRIHLPAHALH